MVLLGFLLYRLGAGLEIAVYPIVSFFLLLWYWKGSDRWSTLAVCCVLLIVASGLGSRICTQLYYRNVSDDGLTIVVGDLVTCLFVSALSIVSVVLIVIKARQKRTQPSE